MVVCAKTAPLDLLTQHKLSQQLLSGPDGTEGGGAGLLIAVGKCRGRRPRGAHTGERKDKAQGS